MASGAPDRLAEPDRLPQPLPARPGGGCRARLQSQLLGLPRDLRSRAYPRAERDFAAAWALASYARPAHRLWGGFRGGRADPLLRGRGRAGALWGRGDAPAPPDRGPDRRHDPA